MAITEAIDVAFTRIIDNLRVLAPGTGPADSRGPRPPLPPVPPPPLAPVPGIDSVLLDQALHHITAHPETHNQRIWIERLPGGVVIGCLAYHVTRLAGATPGFCRHMRYTSLTDRGLVIDVATRALRIDARTALHLFAPTNTVERLWEIANQITDGEIPAPTSAGARR